MHSVRDPRLSFCLLLAFGFAACGGGDDGTSPDDNDANGTFSATISGPVNSSLSGYAWQSGTIVDPQTNEPGWVVFLGSETNAGSAVYMVRLGDRPGSGTYSFTDLSGTGGLVGDQFGAIATVALNGGVTFAGFSSGGTLTITSSSDERVQGSFNVQIEGFDPNTQLEVTATVSGTFNAVRNNFAFPGF